MAYVPPALRKQQDKAAEGETSANSMVPDARSSKLTSAILPSIDDIQKHFWPTQETSVLDPSQAPANDGNTSSVDKESQEKTNGDLPTEEPRSRTKAHSTLNSTEEQPDSLSYVLLFHDAHPRWKEEKIIYVKSELQLLPTQVKPSDSDSQPPNEAPTAPLANNIMFFQQDVTYGRTNDRFKFIGYHKLTRMDVLEPQTPELVRMLEQKWTRTNRWGKSRQIPRNAVSWQKSLSYRWAVLKFEEDEGTNKTLGTPPIEVSEEPRRRMREDKENVQPPRSVNDMLKDMRLGNDNEIRDEGTRTATATRAWSKFHQRTQEKEKLDHEAGTEEGKAVRPTEAKYTFEETFRPANGAHTEKG